MIAISKEEQEKKLKNKTMFAILFEERIECSEKSLRTCKNSYARQFNERTRAFVSIVFN